jgi:hypothetical protein
MRQKYFERYKSNIVPSIGGQTAILVHWSAGPLPSMQTTEMLADQRQWTTEIELPLFPCSEFWPIKKNI